MGSRGNKRDQFSIRAHCNGYEVELRGSGSTMRDRRARWLGSPRGVKIRFDGGLDMNKKE